MLLVLLINLFSSFQWEEKGGWIEKWRIGLRIEKKRKKRKRKGAED